MYNEQIVNRQLFYLLFIMRSTIVISFMPVLAAAEAAQDAWIAGIISMTASAAVIYMIARLAIAFPRQSIVQYSQELLGPVPGKLISLVVLGLFLFMAGTDLRIYGEVIKTGFMIETPLVVIMALMSLLAAAVVYGGIEPLGRAADIIFPVFLLMILGTVLAPLWEADFSNLQPVLYAGWSPVLLAAITPTAITAQYANLAMLTPSLDEPKKGLKTALLSIVAVSLVLVFTTIVVVAVLGPDMGSRSLFPAFKMIRAIVISEFLERVEVLTILAWGLGLFITLSLHLYSGSKGLSQVLGIKENRPLILPMSVIWVVFGIHGYRDIFEMRQFFSAPFVAPFVGITLVFPFALLWVAYLIRQPWNKMGGGGNKGGVGGDE